MAVTVEAVTAGAIMAANDGDGSGRGDSSSPREERRRRRRRRRKRRRSRLASSSVVVVALTVAVLLLASSSSRFRLPLPTARALTTSTVTAVGGGGKAMTTTATATRAERNKKETKKTTDVVIVAVVAEDVWRTAANEHRARIRDLLKPGLLDPDHPRMRSVRDRFVKGDDENEGEDETDDAMMTMLDPEHPVYNFLVEYYGLKGLKGPKRLARWSPSVGLYFPEEMEVEVEEDEHENENDDDDEEEEGRSKPSSSSSSRVVRRRIDTLGEYRRAAGSYRKKVRRRSDEEDYEEEAFSVSRDDRGRDVVDRAIFLEGGSPDDFGLTLHLRGAEWIDGDDGDDLYGGRSGILYRPLRFYDDDDDDVDVDDAEENEGRTSSNAPRGGDDHNHRKATSFVWYRSILETTMSNEPVLSCYGLHEWAMQYRPEGAPPPPSGKYQSHLTLRVSREEINATVERKGIRCTHVDALRFFAPGAGELNRHGSVLERTDQLDLEQPGCVHAHMDLLKVALRIQPLLDPDLLIEILSTALDARALDVGASPYDCSGYSLVGGDRRRVVEVIPIETSVGRDLYRKLQTDLMREASAVRADLLSNYEAYGALAFTPTMLQRAIDDPGDERFARAVPGGRSWRRSLFDRPAPRGTNDDDDETGVTTKKKKRKKKEGSS